MIFNPAVKLLEEMRYFNCILCQLSIYCLLVPNLPSYLICISATLCIFFAASTILNCASRGCWRDTAGGRDSSWFWCAVIVLALATRFWDIQCCCAPAVHTVHAFPLWTHSPGPGSVRSSCSPPDTDTVGLRLCTTLPLSCLRESWFPLFTCRPPLATCTLEGCFLFACGPTLPGQSRKLLCHPLGCSHIFYSEVRIPALGGGSSFQVCSSLGYSSSALGCSLEFSLQSLSYYREKFFIINFSCSNYFCALSPIWT